VNSNLLFMHISCVISTCLIGLIKFDRLVSRALIKTPTSLKQMIAALADHICSTLIKSHPLKCIYDFFTKYQRMVFCQTQNNSHILLLRLIVYKNALIYTDTLIVCMYYKWGFNFARWYCILRLYLNIVEIMFMSTWCYIKCVAGVYYVFGF